MDCLFGLSHGIHIRHHTHIGCGVCFFINLSKTFIMKQLFLDTIQEVENLKTLLKSDKISYRYLKMKGQYLFNYPEDLSDKVVELGY
jgi:hypothetical protein